MADVTKEIALKVVATDATGPALESLEDKLNAAKKRMVELAAAGKQNTEEFQRLQVEAGGYKRTIEGVEQSVDSFAKGGSRALTLMVEASQAVAAGFAIAQGAASLFGDENEDLQKAMLKVQGAMALVNGVQQISILLTQKSVITTEAAAAAQKLYAFAVGTATGAMRAFRIALAATGIGAIVVVLGLAAEALGLFSTKSKDAADSQKDLKRSLEDTAGTLEYYERKLKANGATEADLAKLRRQTLLNEKAELDRKLQEDVARFGVKNDKYQNSLRQELDLLKIKIKEETQIIDADAKQRADKEKADRDRKNAENKAQDDREKAQLKQNTDARLAEQERIRIIEIEAYYERLAALKQFEADKEAAIIAGMQKEAALRMSSTSAAIARDKATKDGQLQRESDLRQAQQQMADQSFSIIGDIITATAGQSEQAQRKAFNVSKAASIAQAIVNTYLAASAALKTQVEVFPGQRFVQAGLAIAAGLANVAKIRATQFQGGGGGTAPSGNIVPSGGGETPAPPVFSNPNVTDLSGFAGGQGQQNQPMRAYVVERDIQQTTSRVRRLSEFATLG